MPVTISSFVEFLRYSKNKFKAIPKHDITLGRKVLKDIELHHFGMQAVHINFVIESYSIWINKAVDSWFPTVQLSLTDV